MQIATPSGSWVMSFVVITNVKRGAASWRQILELFDCQLTGAGWVDIGVEEWGHELDLGRSGGEVILEDDLPLVEAALPRCALLTGDTVPAVRLMSVQTEGASQQQIADTYSQSIRFMVPSAFFIGLAMKPNG